LNEIIFDEKELQTLISTTPIQIVAISTHAIQPVQTPPRAMETIFVALAFPAQLHDFPHNYTQSIKSYDAEENASS
jgi:hypothetical protein